MYLHLQIDHFQFTFCCSCNPKILLANYVALLYWGPCYSTALLPYNKTTVLQLLLSHIHLFTSPYAQASVITVPPSLSWVFFPQPFICFLRPRNSFHRPLFFHSVHMSSHFSSALPVHLSSYFFSALFSWDSEIFVFFSIQMQGQLIFIIFFIFPNIENS